MVSVPVLPSMVSFPAPPVMVNPSDWLLRLIVTLFEPETQMNSTPLNLSLARALRPVDVEVSPVMGGCEDKTAPHPGATGPRLRVRGFVMMGGLEIKNR